MIDLNARKRIVDELQMKKLTGALDANQKVLIEESKKDRTSQDSRINALISGLGDTLGKALSDTKVLSKEPDGYSLSVKFKDEGGEELNSSLDKIGQGLVVIYNHLKGLKFNLPKLFQVQGDVNVGTVDDLPPIHVENFKDLKPYFDGVEKATKYLATAITLVSSKGQEQKAPIVNFDTKPLITALQSLKGTSGNEELIAELKHLGEKISEIKPSDNKSVVNLLRNVSEGIGALYDKPTFVPPAVTHTSINALQGVPFTTAVTVTSSATPLPTTPLDSRRSILIFNNSANTIYIGGVGVTTSNGLPLVSSSFSPVLDLGKNSIIYGIAATNSAVRVLEVSDENSGR